MDLPTRLDLYALGRDYVLQRATKLDPAVVDYEGSDANIVVGVSSVMADHIVKHLGYRISALTLDGAEGEDLDRYAWDHYQLTRKGASPAVGKVRINRPAVTFGAGSIPIGTKLQTTTGGEYITTTVAAFGVGDLQTSANVRALNAGKAAQVGKGQIRRFSQPSSLFDSTLTVTNDDVTAHGEDVESDDDFRNRIRRFWKTARRGILPAIEQGALTVPGVVSAQAIEVLAGDQPARVVNLYIADSTGVASDVLASTVRAALFDYRAGGIAVIISTSIPFIVSIELLLTFRANVDTVTLTDQIRAAIVEFVNSLPVNSTLAVGDLYSVLRRFVSDGLIVNENTIVAPTGDLVPALGQTLRTTPSSIAA